MRLSFPHDLCFYGTCCDIIDMLIIDQDTIIIDYHESLGSVPGDRFSYRCRSSDLTSEQFDTICHYKSFMVIEPKSNPTKYVNVIPAQRNMDIVFSYITNHPTHRVVFQETESDIIEIDDGIETVIPKWQLRDDQIAWIRYLITKQR